MNFSKNRVYGFRFSYPKRRDLEKVWTFWFYYHSGTFPDFEIIN